MSIFSQIRRRFFKNKYEKFTDDIIIPRFKRIGKLLKHDERAHIFLDDVRFPGYYCHVLEFIKHHENLIVFHLAGLRRYLIDKNRFIEDDVLYLNKFGLTQILEEFCWDSYKNEYKPIHWNDVSDTWKSCIIFNSVAPKINFDALFHKLDLVEVGLL